MSDLRPRYGVTLCPRCDKPMLIDERGYGCSNCWTFGVMDLAAAPLQDLRVALDSVERQRWGAEEKLLQARAEHAKWVAREAQIRALLADARDEKDGASWPI